MATTVPNGTLNSISAAHNIRVRQHSQLAIHRPRRLSPHAGRAIEMLAHAIEYLADEFALECMSSGIKGNRGQEPRMEAIGLMMQRNREIYLSCPEIPALSERFQNAIRSLWPAKES